MITPLPWKTFAPPVSLRAGGCIVADNMIFPERAREEAQAYQAHVRAEPSVCSTELTIGDGLEMTVKVA
jgi:predicted O-methyltransferase YrrM